MKCYIVMPSQGEKAACLTARYLWRWWDFVRRRKTFSGTRGQKKGVSEGIFKILKTLFSGERWCKLISHKERWINNTLLLVLLIVQMLLRNMCDLSRQHLEDWNVCLHTLQTTSYIDKLRWGTGMQWCISLAGHRVGCHSGRVLERVTVTAVFLHKGPVVFRS